VLTERDTYGKFLFQLMLSAFTFQNTQVSPQQITKQIHHMVEDSIYFLFPLN